METLFTAEAIISLLTLTFLEVVLGIDNIIFISIAANKLPRAEQAKARNIGLLAAMFFRIGLLFAVSLLISLSKPFATVNSQLFDGAFSGQSVILIVGGLFLLYKATSEIHHKLEGKADVVEEGKPVVKTAVKKGVAGVIFQIILIDMVFSIDSILTAVGLTQNYTVIVIAIVVSVGIMLFFAGPVGRFINEHPSIQMLGLAFLIMIGFMLIAEGAHLADVVIFNQEIGSVPKGYLYFAIAFSLLVEFLNMRIRRSQKPVELNTYSQQAEREGVI
ncbi:TerC family protein [Nibrella saemangeumensis]|uniref:TerC family protein n=1 Tax=Nibrella saemangeumensis TaxID=1084526 RepID=A0ABP8N2T0_9BACT